MDRPAPQTPQPRDIVFCHQCENEWYRDEHGMTPCPECGSDFTEVIEEGRDPREEPELDTMADNEDMDSLRWRGDAANHPTGDQQGTGTGGGMGWMGLLGSAVQAALSTAQQMQAAQQQHATVRAVDDTGRTPEATQDQQSGGGGTYVRHTSGPGFSYTIRSNVSNRDLRPRDANGPQPFQNHPEHINRTMARMLANIGAPPTGQAGTFRFGPPPMFGPPPWGRDFGDDDSPFSNHPFGDIIRMMGMPAGGVHGDAVYSQEALDRVISQMMDQNRTGNAPGPASSQAIDSLPTKQITSSDMDESGKADCTICMDEVPLGTTVTVLPCAHWFHFDCIKSWLTEHDTCPHCRKGIMPQNGDAQGSSSQTARAPGQTPMHDTHDARYQAASGMPGGFPPGMQSNLGNGDGTWQHPITVPDSPARPSSDTGRSSTGGGDGGGGLFNRMRDAFGGGSRNDATEREDDRH